MYSKCHISLNISSEALFEQKSCYRKERDWDSRRFQQFIFKLTKIQFSYASEIWLYISLEV